MKHIYDMTKEERNQYIKEKGRRKVYDKLNNKLKYIMKEKMGYETI